MDHLNRAIVAGSALVLVVMATVTGGAQAQVMPVVSYPSGLHGSHATAKRATDGHFYFDTSINNVSLNMMFDTGATLIALRAEDAAKIGINMSSLTYSGSSNTANGKAEIAFVTIPSLTVGGITRRNVPATVARPGKLFNNLLGQSFLSQLAGLKLDGDQLVLQGE